MTAMNKTNKRSEAKKISMSFEAEQESVLLSALSYYGVSFGLLIPRKRSESCQFLDIVSISFDGKMYEVTDLIEHIIVSSNKTIDPSCKNFTKYNKRNHVAATTNLLIELLMALGWKIHLKNSKESEITLKMARISAMCMGGFTLTSEDISGIGKEINNNIKEFLTQCVKGCSITVGNECMGHSCFNDLNGVQFSFDPLHQMLSAQVSNQINPETNGNVTAAQSALDGAINPVTSVACTEQKEEAQTNNDGLPPMPLRDEDLPVKKEDISDTAISYPENGESNPVFCYVDDNNNLYLYDASFFSGAPSFSSVNDGAFQTNEVTSFIH